MFHIFSLYFLQVFFQFSPTFPNDKTELFPSSSVDGCLQEHWDWQDFLLQGMLPVQKFINRLHDFCVNRSCTCCGNVLETSRIASRLCVCVRVRVRMTFSASATATMSMIENHPSLRVPNGETPSQHSSQG